MNSFSKYDYQADTLSECVQMQTLYCLVQNNMLQLARVRKQRLETF